MSGAQQKTEPSNVTEDGKGIIANLPADELTSSLNGFRQTGEFCDVSVTVKNKKYAAHKLLLASLSPWFKACFAGNFSESEEASVDIKSIDAPTMELILDYMYQGSCAIDCDNVQDVLQAANYLQISSLLKQCTSYLESNLDAANCLGLYRLAKIYHCHSLEKKAKEYSLKNFANVCVEDEFLELDSENLIALVQSDMLSVPTEADEVQVYNAVIQWLNYKEEERTPALPKILAQVRLAHIPLSFLYCQVEPVPAIKNSSSCMRLLKRAIWYQSVPNSRLELQSSVSRRRRQWSQVEVMLMYAEISGKQGKCMVGIGEDGRVVKEFTQPPAAFESCYMNNSQTGCIGVVWESIYCQYSPHTNWSAMSLFSKKRHWFGFAEANGSWFAIGGMHSESGVCDNVDKYCINGNTGYWNWEAVAPLPTPVYNPAVVTLRGKIYVLGGLDNHRQSTSAVQRYDPESDTWTHLEPLPVKRGEFKACGIHDQIYVCQVFSNIAPEDKMDDSRHVYMYNIATNKWETCSKLSHSFVSGPVPFNGNMFVLTERADKERILEKYSPSSDSWKDFANFRGYKPFLITGPLLINRPSTEYDPKGPLNFVHLIRGAST